MTFVSKVVNFWLTVNVIRLLDSWNIRSKKCIIFWISYQFMSTFACKPSEGYYLEYKDVQFIFSFEMFS